MAGSRLRIASAKPKRVTIEAGLTGTAERVVGEQDTARVFGSGDVDVFATPAVVALCEAAAVDAVSGALSAGETTVGVRVELDHTAPTLPGGRVVARARLDRVDGRTLEFTVSASDERGEIASGRHLRVVVDRERFLRSARER